jgi:hypothetical protein
MNENPSPETIRRVTVSARKASEVLAEFGRAMVQTAGGLKRDLDAIAPPRVGQRVTWTDDFGVHNGVVVDNLYAGRICVKPDGTEQTGALPRLMLTKI